MHIRVGQPAFQHHRTTLPVMTPFQIATLGLQATRLILNLRLTLVPLIPLHHLNTSKRYLPCGLLDAVQIPRIPQVLPQVLRIVSSL